MVECSAYSNAICADQGTTKNPTQRIRETVLNSSRRKDEFLRQLRLEQLERDQGLGRKRGDEEDVDGEIKVHVWCVTYVFTHLVIVFLLH